jgi:rubrerythrin
VASPYQLFRHAERVERLSAELYRALADRFPDDAEARALFSRLEAEEEQHANRVRLLAAHYRNDPKLPVEADAGELEACAAECEQAIAEVEAGAWNGDAAAVRRRLAALEERLARAHADLLARNASPALREFLAQLAALDSAHARLLAP